MARARAGRGDLWAALSVCCLLAVPPLADAQQGPPAATLSSIASPPPLTEAQRAVFLGSPEDPPVMHLGGATEKLKGKHYLTGNENALDVLEPTLRGRRGGFVGVGSDQAYLFIGWTQAELAWLTDYDLLVVQVHDLYFAFFRAAKDPYHFLHYWSREGRSEARSVLDAAYQGKQLEAARALYENARNEIYARLTRLAERQRAEKVPSYLWDQGQYDYVANLIRAGRVRRMSGNLLDKQALTGIADSARKLSVPIRVLYTSNAEEYWHEEGYADQFRDNVRTMHFDDRSLIVRTVSTWQENKDYRYVAQPAANFIDWLGRPWLRTVLQIHPRTPRSRRAIAANRYPFILFEQSPDDSLAGRFAAREIREVELREQRKLNKLRREQRAKQARIEQARKKIARKKALRARKHEKTTAAR